MNQYDLDKVYTYHPPKKERVEDFVILREKAKELASMIQEKCPESREKSLAFTKLEEVIMWANAAIARE